MQFRYSDHGFCGKLYLSDNQDNWHNTIIIVLQGMAGLEQSAAFAKLLAANNVDALALAYYGVDPLPPKPKGIPLEQFEGMITLLKRLGYRHFGIYGTSRGASTALLAASHIPDFSCVIALSPVRFVYQGSGNKGSMYTYKGKEIDYIPRKGVRYRLLKRIVKERRLLLLYLFEEWEENAKKKHEIAVENINGRILLLSSTHDESLPSRRHCEKMVERLMGYQFSHEFRHINYEEGSHNLGYCSNKNTWVLPRERHFPKQCQEAREEALKAALDFIYGWMGDFAFHAHDY